DLYFMKKPLSLFFYFVFFLFMHPGWSQKIISGIVKDSHSDERIPFASITFTGTHIGKLTDSAGTFTFYLKEWPSDTLEFTNVGFQPFKFFIDKTKDSIYAIIPMERGKY